MNGLYTTCWSQVSIKPQSLIFRLRTFLRDQTLSALSRIRRPIENKSLKCIFCHHVFDDQRNNFERLILKMKSFGKFIDTDTCVQVIKGDKKIDQRYYHLSFDDGFRNNYTNALPILLKYNIPAIFFIPSSLMDANWEQAKRYCFETTRYRSVFEILRWKDLEEMVSLGYEIGSHSKNHVRFSKISENLSLLHYEMAGSKEEIEKNLGKECKYLSWPYGKPKDIDINSIKAAKKAGYHACFSAYRGNISGSSTGEFEIPRHHFEPEWPTSHIEYFMMGHKQPETHLS